MPESDYELEADVWRDEQPGDEPAIHVSVVLRLPTSGTSSEELGVTSVRLQQGARSWVASQTSIERLDERTLQVRARGEATLGAGARCALTIALVSSSDIPASELSAPGRSEEGPSDSETLELVVDDLVVGLIE